MKTLQELMEHITHVWKCDPVRYPELEGMNEVQRKNFLVKHSVLHIAKSNGKVAALCEDFDHSQVVNEKYSEELQTLAVKMFVNSLKLAEEAGLPAEELLKKAPTYIK